jgi:hypothetical protein
MTDASANDEVARWNRNFGAALFNQTWELIEKPERTEDDDIAMLLSAASSRWHWGRAGGPGEIASGDWQVAHVLSLMGEGGLAMRFARRNLATAEAEGWTGWRLASAHEGMARAYAAQGDADGRAQHVAACEAALADEPDEDDRKVIADQLATVPAIDQG